MAATLTTLYDRLLGKGSTRVDARWMEARPKVTDSRLRPFPNEDVSFHVKRIDNSHVIREQDPRTGKFCWKTIGAASVCTALVIGLGLPVGYRRMAGYQIEDLKQEYKRLQALNAELELREAKLLSPERLAELARLQEFVDPDPGRVIHLDEQSRPVMAMGREVKLGAPAGSAPADPGAR
ncbi:MAG: Cell division protein FtsL [Bryobacteraceae bacterium]|nr:Cell division protein FtsL [Bryobacteraceae bacterium]